MRCIIVDDEPIARRGMKRMVERHEDVELCGVFAAAEEAAAFLETNKVDLIFLDIQMPGMTGTEFARTIKDDCMVIFTTAYSEYAVEGFELDAVDYLVKPIDPKRFDLAVDKAREYLRLISVADASVEQPTLADEFLIVKSDRRYMRIRISEITYIEGLKDYIVIHQAGRKIVTRMTIKGMEEMLPKDKFLRVNKSYIVNLDYVDSFDTNDIYIGTREIAIGQSYKESVLSHLLP